jgi:hypothetical protein
LKPPTSSTHVKFKQCNALARRTPTHAPTNHNLSSALRAARKMLRTYALTRSKNTALAHRRHYQQLLTNTSQTTRARAAILHLPHGPVQLPIFMPVATQASLKGLTPKQLEETGCRLCLNNTYHLYAAPIVPIALIGREHG